MGKEDNRVIVYASQADPVMAALERDGVCFSKKEYVIKKYEESAPIFVAAYSFFISEAQRYAPKPEGAEYPYWAFKDLYNVDKSGNDNILKLSVPLDEAVFFDMHDWTKVMRLQYIGATKEDEEQFRKMLIASGVRRESDVILTSFYPDFKRQVQDSWKRIFRHHEQIKAGDTEAVANVQVGLWQLKKEWII